MRSFGQNTIINQMESLNVKTPDPPIIEGLDKEPEMPIMHTTMPGTNTIKQLEQLSKLQVMVQTQYYY